MGRENDFRNVPPQMAQNKGNLQLHFLGLLYIPCVLASVASMSLFIYLFLIS